MASKKIRTKKPVSRSTARAHARALLAATGAAAPGAEPTQGDRFKKGDRVLVLPKTNEKGEAVQPFGNARGTVARSAGGKIGVHLDAHVHDAEQVTEFSADELRESNAADLAR